MSFRQLVIEPVKKRIPRPIKMRLRVYRYYARLIQHMLADRPGWNPFHLFRTIHSRRRILFYPDVPYESSAMHQICLSLDLRITNDPRKQCDLIIKWRDSTFYTPDSILLELAKSQQVINLGCNDISKKHVEAVFQEVFGYGSFVDPQSYMGKCVQKSDLNAKHDGKIIDCPVVEVEDDAIYQILIDSSCDECTVKNLRLPVYGDTFSYLLVQIIPREARFTDVLGREIAAASDYFTKEEQEKILLFCRRMGLDYGDLDIMRDGAGGRLYILDVNNTPDGFSPGSAEARETINFDAKVFEDSFLPARQRLLYGLASVNSS